VSPECAFQLTFWQRYFLISCFPLILFVLISAVYFTKQWWYSKSLKKDQLLHHLKVVLAKTLSLVLSLYVMMMGNAMAPFNCTGSASGNTFVLVASPSEQCYVPESKWNQYLGATVFGALFYAVGVPGITLFILVRNRKDFHKPFFQQNLRFLIVGFRKKYYFWEPVIISKRMLFVLITALSNISTSFNLKFASSIGVVVLFTAFEVFALPYSTHARNSRALT
jgi:hypothetical protein